MLGEVRPVFDKAYVTAVEGIRAVKPPDNYLSLQQMFSPLAQSNPLCEVAAGFTTDQRNTIVPFRTTQGTRDQVTPPFFSIKDMDSLVVDPVVNTYVVLHSHPFHLRPHLSETDIQWFHTFYNRIFGYLQQSIFHQPVQDTSLSLYVAAATLTDQYIWQGATLTMQLRRT